MTDTARKPTALPAEAAHAAIEKLRGNVAGVFLGKPKVVHLVLTSMLAGGHVLLEDVPGVGKTLLAHTLARSMAGDFRRVQFTPDLLPADILGVSIYDPNRGVFEFKPGPIFTHVLVADEVNRATPRTQSALLEAMNEAQVSVDRTSHPLPQPFFVIATQNPAEFEGTYPLPESQLDRFMVRIRIGYPSPEDEAAIVRAQEDHHPLHDLEAVIDTATMRDLQASARAVHLADDVLEYALALVRATRESRKVHLGVSPRGSLALTRAARAYALVSGRDFVTPDDVKALAAPVLAHRIVPQDAVLDGSRDPCDALVRSLIEKLRVPV